MKSFDFLDLLGDVPEDLVASCFAAPAVPEHRVPRPWLKTGLAAGTAAAACIAAVAGIGCLLQDDGLTQQSSSLEAMMQEVVTEPVETVEPAQTAPAVTAPPEETPAVPARTETAPAVTEPAAEPTPTETESAATEAPPAEPAPAETQPPAEPEPAPEQPVFEPGDVDMDGRITYVDAALVMVDINLAQYGMLDHSLITEEQRALGNVNGLDNGKLLNTEVPYIEITDAETGALVTVNNYVAFPLEFEDYLAIHTVAYLRNWYGADINMQDVMNAINSDPFSIAEYQNSHETIRPNWKEAGDLCDEMGMALTFHYPLDTHELLYDEKGNLLYGDLKYTTEDFWNMARQMLVYFEDTK